MGRPKSDDPRCVALTVRMTESEADALRSQADAAGVSMARLLVSAIERRHVCETCQGAREITAECGTWTDRGPMTWQEVVDCPECKGEGLVQR